MEKLILDWSTWRCGGETTNNSVHRLGDGCTQLLNSDGYMCCLGQFSLQLNKELTIENIEDMGEPNEIGIAIPLLTEDDDFGVGNSILSDDCIDINDNPLTPPEEKVELLRAKWLAVGYEIEVINKP